MKVKNKKFNKNICRCPKCKNGQFFIFDTSSLIKPILYCTECNELIAYLNKDDIKIAKELINKQRESLPLFNQIQLYVSEKKFPLEDMYSYEYYSFINFFTNFCLEHNIVKINN